MRNVKDSPRASVRVGYDGRVHKAYKGRMAEERFHNEARILRYLEQAGCDFVPRILSADAEKLELVMTNCGQPADQIGKEKLAALFEELECFGVCHKDQASRNITYDPWRSRFCVIDFEYATVVDRSAGFGENWNSVNWSGKTECGPVRARNDDTVSMFTLRDGGFEMLENDGEANVNDGDVVFLISDGMGGESSGDLASALIVGRMREALPVAYRMEATRIYPDRLRLISETLELVHDDVTSLAEKKPDLARMGATVTLAWLSLSGLHFGHVGDTRLYHYRQGKLVQLTKDHTRAWDAFDRGEINERQFRTHPRRSVLKQAIGGGVQKIDPQMGSIIPTSGDWFLLCSDGLVGGLWEKHLEEAFGEGDQGVTPEEMTDRLLSRSLKVDGSDNVSLICFRIE